MTIIAVDGPAGSGKSTLCAQVSRRIGLTYVNTGAIYRAVAVLAMKEHIPFTDHSSIATMMERYAYGFRWDDQQEKLFVGDWDITPFLYTADVGNHASVIALSPQVREYLLPIQRRLALHAPKGALLDGRDIGTVVFPDATLKIFMTASLEERAKRRLTQLHGQRLQTPYPSVPSDLPTWERLMDELAKRDLQDSSRAIAPLIRAPDALELDTSHMNPEEALQALEHMIRKHLSSSSSLQQAL